MRTRATSRWTAPAASTDRAETPPSSWTHRSVEAAAVLGVAVLSVDLAWELTRAPTGAATVLAVTAALLLGWIAADLVSGLVHWFADRIASERTPWIGPTFIRPFREHHDDPRAITHHGFLETNGNTCIVTAPVLLAVAASVDPRTGGPASAFAAAFALFVGFAVCATNEIHKWAHQRAPGPSIRWLQQAGLVLRPDHHALHHRPPFATHFCITTGWLNAALDRARLFSSLERIAARWARPSGDQPAVPGARR